MWRRSPTEDSRRAGAWRCDGPPRALGHTGRHQGGEAAGNGSRGAGRRAHARQILEVRSRQIPLWLRVSARTSGVLLRHEVLDLTRLVDARPRQARVLPRQLHPVERLQVVEPHRLGVVLCEEDLADPLLVAALEEAQHKGGHTHDLLRPDNLDLAGGAAHRRAASGAAETGRVADSVGVELLRAHEWHVKEGLRARVARHEHVVRDDAEPHLLAPLVGPHLRVVVDAAHHGRLRADDHARLLLEAVDGVPHLVGRQLTHVAQVRHHRDVPPAHLLDLAQQREELVGVGVGREALRPKRERARADAQVLDVRQEGRVLEGLEVLLEDARLHDHRVAAGEEDVGDLLVLGEVVEERARVLLREAQVRVADELRPAEAVRAVRVARLRRRGEEQHRLRVLVLHARQLRLFRRVEGLLPRGVRVELLADLLDGRLDCQRLLRGARLLERRPRRRLEHVHRRKDEPVERVGRDVAFHLPVNQLLDQVRRRFEREDE
mmetsp:Transcript_39919/g.132060  ORF Transcript_39919/g.132060 Transcript_39919/m.132060 type:complete len:492 (+) Transcript_39919:115-1590(+)